MPIHPQLPRLLLIPIVSLFTLVALSCGSASEPDASVPSPTITKAPSPSPTIAIPTQETQPTLTATPVPTRTAIPTATAFPTATAAPTAIPTIQPTHPAVGRQVVEPTTGMSIEVTGQHHQWIYGGVDYPARITAQHGAISSRSVSNDVGGVRRQQYTCVFYVDGQVARTNLYFDKELSYTVVTNQYGELQGKVRTVTTVDGEPIQVSWTTWTSRVDRLRLRGTDAVRLVKAIQGSQATEFRLHLSDDPDLSANFDVSNLIDAMSANDLSCFNPN